ncbi:MAG: GNAT family N-acetyltransferase [Gemmatimonadaceae bacterium]
MADTPSVTHDEAAHEFEIPTGEGRALLKYVRHDDVLDLVHTEVAEQFEGRGYASALARAALAYARANHLTVVATCPFVRTYLDRHPEYDDLRAKR